MLTKGFDTEYHVIMKRITVYKITAKGVVYPFLTPRCLAKH